MEAAIDEDDLDCLLLRNKKETAPSCPLEAVSLIAVEARPPDGN